jgi:hypothetical protein
MITKVSIPLHKPCEEEADIVIVHYTPREKTEGYFIQFIRPVVKWFGTLSTIALSSAALAPSTFNVPPHLRPWVFLAFIFWSFAFCAGFFNL